MGKKSKQKGGRKDRRHGAPEARAVRAHLTPQPWLAPAGSSEEAEGVPPMGGGPDAGASAARTSSELAARMAGLGTLLQRQLARADAGDGLTRARLSALSLLVLGGPRTLGHLAAAERVRPPTMTRLVQAMEEDGLVVREPHPSDRRSILVRATTDGEALLEQGQARRVGVLADLLASLDEPERREVHAATDLLERLLRTMGPDAALPRA